jgi:hypothetical protein
VNSLTVDERAAQDRLRRLRCFLCRQPVRGGLLLADPATNLLGWYVRENGRRVQLVADHSEAHLRVCLGQQSLPLWEQLSE